MVAEPGQPGQDASCIHVFPEDEIHFGIVAKNKSRSAQVEILRIDPGSRVLLFSVRIIKQMSQRPRETR